MGYMMFFGEKRTTAGEDEKRERERGGERRRKSIGPVWRGIWALFYFPLPFASLLYLRTFPCFPPLSLSLLSHSFVTHTGK
jgi:hypothetical protein